MDEYIEKQFVLNAIKYYGYRLTGSKEEAFRDLFRCIERETPAMVQKVKHGFWHDGDGNPVGWQKEFDGCLARSAYCSECNEWLMASDEYFTTGKYCPNCGAKMDAEG